MQLNQEEIEWIKEGKKAYTKESKHTDVGFIPIQKLPLKEFLKKKYIQW